MVTNNCIIADFMENVSSNAELGEMTRYLIKYSMEHNISEDNLCSILRTEIRGKKNQSDTERMILSAINNLKVTKVIDKLHCK